MYFSCRYMLLEYSKIPSLKAFMPTGLVFAFLFVRSSVRMFVLSSFLRS